MEWTIAAADKNECEVTLSIEGNRDGTGLPADTEIFMSPKDRSRPGSISVLQPELAIADAEGEKILELSERRGAGWLVRARNTMLNPAAGANS